MGIFFAIIFLLVIAAIAVVPVILVSTRRTAREQKNYERGLKMVSLLIHLPPISEDTEANGRDIRELIDENVSKAQIIYNIIASTYQKGFKRRIYGQQHLAFEIVGSQGFIYFYTVVPAKLVDVVSQAIVSAYPSARLEEAEEHNIFSIVGKTTGTTGGELSLKESFAYPISTYMDLKRDAMQSMLNSLSTAGKEDGAAIQILMRPADPGWRKVAHGIASDKRKGKKGKGGAAKTALGVAKELGTAFYKVPESKSDGGSDKPDLSELEQNTLNAIDDKTRYPAYEVLIRLIASSNVTQRSQTLLNNMVASFSIFDAPGRNGFKYTPAKDTEELITAYAMRFFPQDKNKSILNAVELATIFHFPDQRSIPTSQLERQDSKQVDGPRNMPETGMLLGYNVFRGVKKPIRLSLQDRQRHMYVVGQTGTGKSTFLENLAVQDMMAGNGFAFVDPHGDTAEKLLAMVPKERTEDVIYFSPADMEYPMGVNLFEFRNPDQKDFLIQEALNMLKKLYDPNNQGIMGPRYEHLFRNAALTVMADPAGGTFVDIPKLFRDPQYVKQKLQYVKDMNVLEFWQKEMPQSQRSNEFGEVVSWFVSKFGAFLSNEMMRNIIGQTKSAFDLRDVMDNKKILLVNLSKGRTGDLNSKLLGMIFVMKFQAAAMSRANIPESDRVDFSLYVDEFQNFSTDSFATIMSEARKYHLNLIVANQFTTQLTEEIRDAVFGNMGTIVAFRIGQNDVESLSRYFQPTFDGDDLLRVPNYNTIVRTLIGGVPTQPFSMSTLPPLGKPNEKLADALKQLSAAKFGRAKAGVEKEIFERIATKDAPPAPGAPPGGMGGMPAGGMGGGMGAGAMPAGGSMAGGAAGGVGARPFGASPWQQQGGRPPANPGFGPAAPGMAGGAASPWQQPPAPAPRSGTGSFMDEWLVKRGPATQGATASSAFPATGGFAPPAFGHGPAPMPTAGPVAAAVPAAPHIGSPAGMPPAPMPGGTFVPGGMGVAPAPVNPYPTNPYASYNSYNNVSSAPAAYAPSTPSGFTPQPMAATLPVSPPAPSAPAPDQSRASFGATEKDSSLNRSSSSLSQSGHAGSPAQSSLSADSEAHPPAKRKKKRKKAKRLNQDDTPFTTKPDSTQPDLVPVAPEKPTAPGVMRLEHDAEDLARLDETRTERQRQARSHMVQEAKDRIHRFTPSDRPAEAEHDGTAHSQHKSKVFGLPEHDEPVVVKPQPDAELLTLRPRSAKEKELNHGDTIYIDQEGNLKVIEDTNPDAEEGSKVAHRQG